MIAEQLNLITKNYLKNTEDSQFKNIIKMAQGEAEKGFFYIIIDEYISERNKNKLCEQGFRVFVNGMSTEIRWDRLNI